MSPAEQATPLQLFLVRYGHDEPIEVYGHSVDAVWDQHFDAAHSLGKGLSFRPVPAAAESARCV